MVASSPSLNHTALPAAMRYILKAESYDRRGVRGKLYCIIAGSAVTPNIPPELDDGEREANAVRLSPKNKNV